MSRSEKAPTTVAGPTTRGRVFAVVSRRNPSWATGLVLIEPGPAVYTRRDGVWALDVLLGRRIARGVVQLRELTDRSKVSTEVSRFDKSLADEAGAAMTRARMPAQPKTAKSKPTATTTTPLTPWQERAHARAVRDAGAVPREGHAVVGRDVLAERRRTREAILASGGLTASAVPVKPRASTPDSLRRDRAALARRREVRDARVARRRHEARSEALVASAVRRGMAVSGMVGRV